jgi:deoxyribose-phosphate aldolase
MTTENKIKKDFIDICHLMHQKGFVAGTEGNMSCKINDSRIIVTPSGVCKGMLDNDQLVIVDKDNKKVSGSLKQSSGGKVNLAIYEERPDINAIIWSHPPVSTAFTIAETPLDITSLPETNHVLKKVPTADFAMHGDTQAIFNSIRNHIKAYDSVLLAHNGLITMGKSVQEAYYKLELVEAAAKTILAAKQLGGSKAVPQKDIVNLAQYIDHTLLSPGALPEDITKICNEAREHHFYAVCVNPIHVKQAAQELQGSGVKVAAVVGFPLGEHSTDIKVLETKECIANGAEEIDMVINIGALKTGNLSLVKREIEEIVKAAGRAPVKVIIETGLLTDEEKVTACVLSVEAKAAFVKTSTGMLKSGKGATVEDVRLMYEVVHKHGLKVKASGGIRDRATGIAMIEAGAERIGASASVAMVTDTTMSSSSGY